jgi:hypothetical protein
MLLSSNQLTILFWEVIIVIIMTVHIHNNEVMLINLPQGILLTATEIDFILLAQCFFNSQIISTDMFQTGETMNKVNSFIHYPLLSCLSGWHHFIKVRGDSST